MSRKLNVGLFDANFCGKSYVSNEVIYGQSVVEKDITNAFLSYGKLRYNYLFLPDQYNYLSAMRLNKKLKNKSINLINKIDLLQKNTKGSFDVYHSISQEFTQLFYEREYLLNKPCPVTFTIHCASKPHIISDTFLNMLMMPFNCYDSMICTSNTVKSVVEKQLYHMSEKFNSIYKTNLKYRGRIDVIPLGVDTDKFKKLSQKEMRVKYNISQDAFVILWLGRLSCYDKADLIPLLKVFRNLCKKNKREIVLIILGGDNKISPYMPFIEKNLTILDIKDKVKLVNGNNNRHEILSTADVFTSPIDNVQETFGLTPIEAMACGIPQIVSDWDGYKETVVDGITGFRIPTLWSKCDSDFNKIPYPTGYDLNDGGMFYSHYLLSQSVALDLEAYEKAFQILIDNNDLLGRMSENSINRARNVYSWDNIIKRYEQLWLELYDIFMITDKDRKYDRHKLSIFSMNYCDIFESYPTSFINEDSKLKIVEDGVEVLEKREKFLLNNKFQKNLYENRILEHVLLYIQNNNVSIKMIIEKFSAHVHVDVVRRCVQMLLKHGYIEISEKEESER